MREVSYYHDVRFNIWGCALQRPQEYAAYGLGAGQSTEYLAERYAEAGLTYYAQDRLHCHNQYLEELMETGVGGLLFFVLIWFAVPLCARGEGRQTAVAFTLLYLLNMFTDCMFGLFDGLVLWAVGLLLVFLQSDPQREEKSARHTETH
jgi:O-antigen ligase